MPHESLPPVRIVLFFWPDSEPSPINACIHSLIPQPTSQPPKPFVVIPDGTLLDDERLLEKRLHSLRGLSTLGEPRLDGRGVEVRLLLHGIIPTQLLLFLFVSLYVRRVWRWRVKKHEIKRKRDGGDGGESTTLRRIVGTKTATLGPVDSDENTRMCDEGSTVLVVRVFIFGFFVVFLFLFFKGGPGGVGAFAFASRLRTSRGRPSRLLRESIATMR